MKMCHVVIMNIYVHKIYAYYKDIPFHVFHEYSEYYIYTDSFEQQI